MATLNNFSPRVTACLRFLQHGLFGAVEEYYLKMHLSIEFEREEDGRWIAEIRELPGVMVYGSSKVEAEAKVQALAFRVLAERLETKEEPIQHIEFAAV